MTPAVLHGVTTLAHLGVIRAEGADAADPALHANSGDEKLSADPDFDLSSAFDVPAFLRRQEG